ncbi:MAG TPA: hypothetical protein VHT30_09575 [Acidimicrobiales bacterium]|jgi:hypothetical protein|nr:hypothetical protein [Acidimicrobiales bacterium]
MKKLGLGRLAVFGGLLAMGVLLAVQSAAFACTNLAELNVGPTSGPAGTKVTVTGSAFANVPSNTPVALHWGSANGPVLATVTPDDSGAIGPFTLTVPANATPGSYVIVASQTEIDNGQTPWGLPARTAFTVSGTAPAGAAARNAAVGSVSSSSGASAGLIALTVALGIGGLALFGLGAATFVGTVRRRALPSRVRSK